MKGKLTGVAFRLLTIEVSVVDLTCELGKATRYEEIRAETEKRSEGNIESFLGYGDEPLFRLLSKQIPSHSPSIPMRRCQSMISQRGSRVPLSTSGCMLKGRFTLTISSRVEKNWPQRQSWRKQVSAVAPHVVGICWRLRARQARRSSWWTWPKVTREAHFILSRGTSTCRCLKRPSDLRRFRG